MRHLFLSFLIGLFFVQFSATADAASLYIDPAFSQLYRGDSAKLAVRLDTDEAERECVNAIDGIITYSDNISPVDISLGDSIFSIWVEKPVIDEKNRTITFAGGIPNGYCGRVSGDPRLTNTVLEIIVRSPGFAVGGENADSIARVDFSPETTAYLNDGLGSKAELSFFGAELTMNKDSGATLKDPWNEEVSADNIPPEKFSIFLEKDEKTFGGKYYIVFNTTDKQTGIDQYQVMEEPLDRFKTFTWGRADAPWTTARSPYVLKDQSLNSTIRVRAFDKAGNEYIATLIPNEDMRGISFVQLMQYVLFGFVALVLLTLIFTATILFQRRKKSSLEVITKQDDE